MAGYVVWVRASIPYRVEADSEKEAIEMYESGECSMTLENADFGDIEEVEAV